MAHGWVCSVGDLEGAGPARASLRSKISRFHAPFGKFDKIKLASPKGRRLSYREFWIRP